MNILFFIICLVVSYAIVVLSYKFLGKLGLFLVSALYLIIVNIFAIESVELAGYAIALGTLLYGTIFLVKDILIEKYGEKIALKSVITDSIVILIFTLLTSLFLCFIPVASPASDAITTVFALIPRIFLGSLVAYIISAFIKIKLYTKIKEKYKKLYLSSNISGLVAQLIDSVIFISIAFIGVFSFATILEILLATYIVKIIYTLFATPYLYWAVKTKKQPNDLPNIK
ncbi:MAG: queuosine precursor transporter [Clostridia bacterium]|nr:queuosine precursor transporter [Clostridia bacterium]